MEHVISDNVVEYEQVEVENLTKTPVAVHVNEEDDLPALVGQTEPIENTNNVPIDFVSVKTPPDESRNMENQPVERKPNARERIL